MTRVTQTNARGKKSHNIQIEDTDSVPTGFVLLLLYHY